ncbi:UNVERIFIED_CONTAM: hypothetical protein PYX00_006869 [Menopon gallinae]|uniref:Transcription termination factor 3, mitochondrial n=1 Tax=Menopon gallinae TaxID=328185 RepID=A0AAW2HWX6_9NEOP
MTAFKVVSGFFSRAAINGLCNVHGRIYSRSKNGRKITGWSSDLPQSAHSVNLPQEEVASRIDRIRIPVVTDLPTAVEQSSLLQKLVDMGVNLHRLKYNPGLCKFLIGADYEKDIAPFLQFLESNGVSQECLPVFISRNPDIFLCDLDDLQVRINYLESKKFTKEMIANIITKNPKWLLFEVKFIDSRLGYLQNSLNLSGDEIRKLAVIFPRVMNIKKELLELNLFTIKEELGLEKPDIKKIVFEVPNILRIDNDTLIATFRFLLNHMGIQEHLLIGQPKILTCRAHVLSARHHFLCKLGRAQYNPKLPGYVPLSDLCCTNDLEFCKNIAKVPLDDFYKFLKSL